MKIFVTNLGKYNEGYLVGKWVKLPVADDKLDEVLKEIGIDDYYEEYFITDSESDIIGLSDVITEYSSISKLNELAKRIENLSDDDADKLGAIFEYEGCCSVETVIELLDNLDSFDLIAGVTDDETLGYYYADELCSIDIPKHLKSYFDYEAYGRDIRLESSCLYTSYGLLLDNR